MPRVVDPGHDGAGKASSADAPKDVEAKASDRRLTFDLHPTLQGELESIDDNPSLDYVTFRLLYERHPEQLFNDLQRHLDKLEAKAGKAPIRGNADSDLTEAREEIAQLKERAKTHRDAMRALIYERDEQ